MNLLVIGMNYAPESTGIAPFTTGLCEELAARGHHVTIATTFPHYPEWRTHEAYRGKWSLTEAVHDVSIRRTPVYIPRGAGTPERVLYDTSLGLGALLSGLRVRGIDMILAVEPPIQAGVVARLLARLKGVPYAVWVQDLALEAAISVGMMRGSFLVRLAQRLEAWGHAGARKIFVISQGFHENLRDKGIPPSNLVYLPNWVDPDGHERPAMEGSFRREHAICDEAVIVLHSGNMGVKQQLENVLDAAALLGDREIVLLLVGDGSQKETLVQYAERAKLSNVRFLPLQPFQAVPEMMAAADIALVNQHPDMVEAVIPSKLLTYMAAARPVVIAAHPDSEAARQVRAADCGIVVPPAAPSALAQAIVTLAGDANRRDELGKRGRDFVARNFARKPLLDTFEVELRAQARANRHA